MDTVHNTAGSSGTKGPNINQTASGLHDKIDQTAQGAGPAVYRAASGAHETVDHLADMASRAAETAQLKSEEFKEMQAKFMENATQYVQTHPMASLGIAMGIPVRIPPATSRACKPWLRQSITPTAALPADTMLGVASWRKPSTYGTMYGC